ncbi:hypothetical protein [Streptomyces sp. DH12]|uniref:hypothetical protein n=1 Tax=Streptomyces sp. DH12 TaxID=2857010 RepID=UPI001E2CDCD9|nr:hypothetical protein [Streptomyces sp. DH12]
MITEIEEPRRELSLADGLAEADVVRVHHEALRVLRDDIEDAHLDAYSDLPWPQEVIPAYARARALAPAGGGAGGRRARAADTGMGIDIDVRDDERFAVLLALAPFTIHAEAWARGRLVLSAGDTGTSLWIAVTARQEADLMARLDALGVPRAALTSRPRRRRPLVARLVAGAVARLRAVRRG